jgi:uncharacterized iron-regulated membrane protein
VLSIHFELIICMNVQQQARLLRAFRNIHRITGATLFVLFFIIAFSGLMLGWKKHSNGYLLPNTQRGSATELEQWLPMHTLQAKAQQAVIDSLPQGTSTAIDRMDVRPAKGVVKVRFEGHHWGVQLDGATGEVLQIAKRRSDWMEALHDGSIIEAPLGIGGGYFKLFYTTVMGVALLLFTVTGFWLWYGPKVLRRQKRRR